MYRTTTDTAAGVLRAPRPTGRHGPRRLAVVFAVLAAALLSLSGVSFLTANDTLTLSIEPRPASTDAGSTLSAGQSVKMTALQDANFTIYEGKANKDAGRLLYKVEIQPDQSNKLYVDFIWADPANANGALKSGWLDVGLYYQVGVDSGSGCGTDQFSVTGIDELDGAQKAICVAPAADQSGPMGQGILTEALAVTTVRSTVANKRFIYLLASATNHGDNIAPGQQGQVGTLTFWANAWTTP